MSHATPESPASLINESIAAKTGPVYRWRNSVTDYFHQTWSSFYSDEQVESRLLSLLPFYPESDSTRTSRIINTDVSDGKFIHEFYIENTQPPNEQSPETLDIVLVHGYAASLGLFIDNYDTLSSIPGIRIHAIDLPGFGFSSRSKFPTDLKTSQEDILKVEDWFIDAIEEWRIKRNINKFTLMGHSFGGYLTSAYTLKYNKPITDDTGDSHNLIDKLVLISPCGFERNKYSLLKDSKTAGLAISKQDREKQNELTAPEAYDDKDLSEALANQEQIVHNEVEIEVSPMEMRVDNVVQKRSGRIMQSLWDKHVSPFSLIRNGGILKSKWISGWTTRRFGHVYHRNPEHFQIIHDYIYRVFNGKGSGEFAITRVYAFAALARLPLLDRCPEEFVNMNLPTLLMYGDSDWMDEKAGLRMQKEINTLSQKKYSIDLSSYSLVPNAGHHLYLDNPPVFSEDVFKFIGAKQK
ncbi:alpha/beta-hydrolase [Suhomyces tanzawaensis NRRL Y-17324]|uniref:Alpha/beta-hydrolase n=1 Tax=Suhomyces tanzawaensis NRRL Y-17324 TaxID=984487 RepID=A0A1E4SI22_9ASCO|nr:alpha/beta-hydrolase [Suhomyces tanzawaensis NRRL Y-17324]ODV79082.1 alpha/beta-hydrolase [Suhomyces tanzawaensis NRRL Y-17324]